MKKFNVFIPNKLFSIPPNQLYVYMLLQLPCSVSADGKSFVSYKMLYYYAYNTTNPSRRQEDAIKDGLIGLLADDIISGKKISKSEFEIDSNSFNREKGEQFSMICFDDIVKIKKPILCKYFAILMYTCNSKTKVGMYSSISLSEYMDCSRRTIYRYNEELEDMQMIYIRRSANYSEEYKSNIYGRYEDKLLIDKYADSLGYSKSDESNQLRSISARYNAFVAGAKLSDEEVAQLYNDCLLYNSIMDEKQTHQPGNDFVMKKKELTIFGY